MKVGDELWYLRNAYTNAEWLSLAITGETKLSWLVGSGWNLQKVNKKTMLSKHRGGSATRWYTHNSMTDKIWIDANRRRITTLVGICDNRALLEDIERMISQKATL